MQTCLLYTSDAADERSSVDLGGRRIIKKKNNIKKKTKKKHKIENKEIKTRFRQQVIKQTIYQKTRTHRS